MNMQKSDTRSTRDGHNVVTLFDRTWCKPKPGLFLTGVNLFPDETSVRVRVLTIHWRYIEHRLNILWSGPRHQSMFNLCSMYRQDLNAKRIKLKILLNPGSV